MGEMIKMVVVLTFLSVISGGALAYVQKNTTNLIEDNKLQFVKGPAIKTILSGTSNNPALNPSRNRKKHAAQYRMATLS